MLPGSSTWDDFQLWGTPSMCQDMDFLVSMSEERKKMLAESLKVRVKVPQTDNNGSKSLSPAKCNYAVYDKELLSVICGLEEWRHILEGTEHMV